MQRDQAAERVAGDVRAVEVQVGEEVLELLAHDVLDRPAVGDQRRRLAVPGQVDQDHLALLGELVEHRVPGLPPMGDAVNENQRVT